MPDDRSPVRRAVILRRPEPELRIARLYSVVIERDLFGAVQLVRSWGGIGTLGRELVQVFESEGAIAALEAFARAKRRRGRWDL